MTAAADTRPRGVDGYVSLFDARQARDGAEPDWLRERRRAAITAFAATGFPTTRSEEWRFTNVAPIAETRFVEPGAVTAPSPAVVGSHLVPGLQGPALVFVDGRYQPGLSGLDRPTPGLTVTPLRGAWRNPAVERHLGSATTVDRRPFAALNSALFEDGAYIEVDAGAVIPGTIQVVHLSSDQALPIVAFPRTLLVAGAHSQVALVEVFAGLGPGRYFADAVTEIAAGEGAVVDHYRLQWESDEAFHVGLTYAAVGRAASVSSHAVAVGGAIARHDAVAVLNGEGADCVLNGFYHADASRLVDNHTDIDHAMPHGTSHELYKGILADRARAVFNGRIRVRPDAQKTNAKQTNKTLLLSDDAQINTTPQLEIFANDVKCTHGATVGQLSADALFYLRARGLAEEAARTMLVHAFASDVVGRMALGPVRDAVERQLARRLPGGGEER